MCNTMNFVAKKTYFEVEFDNLGKIGHLRYLSDLFSQKKSDNYGTCPKIGQLRYIYCKRIFVEASN